MRNTNESAYHYIAETFAEETKTMRQARRKGEELYPGMQISPAEGKLLYCLARMVRANHMLEIGTFVGYSTLWLARAVSEGGQVITLESNAKHATLAREHFRLAGMEDHIHIHKGPALDTLEHMAAERKPMQPLDLVFIDATKAEYGAYLDLVESRVRPGGLIIGDNTLLFGALIGQPRMEVGENSLRAMREFNRRLSDPSRYDAILIPTEEGLTVAVKR